MRGWTSKKKGAYTASMLLMLDIDGCCHPVASDVDRLFCRRGEIWRLLAALPELEIVISSSWRDAYPVEDLQDMLCHGGGEHLAHRILGTTPCVATAGGPPPEADGIRELECLAWLAGHGLLGGVRPWLAVDDTPGFFLPGCRNLHVVDGAVGLTSTDVATIISRLRGWTAMPAWRSPAGPGPEE